MNLDLCDSYDGVMKNQENHLYCSNHSSDHLNYDLCDSCDGMMKIIE